MFLSWEENKLIVDAQEKTGHISECVAQNEGGIRLALGECVEKSISLLQTNINNESLYLMFEWCALSSILTVVVTDSSKKIDSQHIVKCTFAKLESEDVQYWLRDYFTTCASFMKYSLVAAFHCDKRSESTLL
ncbi:MAG: hypothetical protein ACJAYE_000945 [Candidatus Azotimanducaceae bacterium]|jgi:hypothetical protein